MFKEKMRQAILKRDNYECQLDKYFNTTRLTNIPCSKRLEVHHKIYGTAPEKEEDGITICKRCHDILTEIIRRIRYEKRRIKTKDMERKIPQTKRKEIIDEKIIVSDYRNNTAVDA